MEDEDFKIEDEFGNDDKKLTIQNMELLNGGSHRTNLKESTKFCDGILKSLNFISSQIEALEDRFYDFLCEYAK